MNSWSLLLGASILPFRFTVTFQAIQIWLSGHNCSGWFSTLIHFSRDIAEFWRRWHISCLLGFEIIYIFRLEVSKGSKMKQVQCIYYFFVVSGFGMA
jgi:hypothetical protein